MGELHETLRPNLVKLKSLLTNDKYDEAQILLEKLHLKFPDEFRLFVLSGSTLFHLDRYEESIGFYDKATELSPRSAWASILKFGTLFSLRKMDAALDEMERFLKLGNAEAYEEELSFWLSQFKQDEDDKKIYEEVFGRVRRIAVSYPPIAKVLDKLDE